MNIFKRAVTSISCYSGRALVLIMAVLPVGFLLPERCGFYWPSILEMIGFGQEMTADEMLEHFKVSLDVRTMFLFFVISIGAIIASTVVPVVYILELNPKEILMKARIE